MTDEEEDDEEDEEEEMKTDKEVEDGDGETVVERSSVSDDLFRRLEAMKSDYQLMDTANDFVFQLLQLAQDEVEQHRRQLQVCWA